MEEPKKVLKAQYLGSTEVNQPTGMEVLNTAIETALNDTKREQWENVNVAVAPSMISINSSEVSRKNIQYYNKKKPITIAKCTRRIIDYVQFKNH